MFARVMESSPNTLGELAEIFVGVQTSADKIYIFQSVWETVATCTLRWNDRDWPIERGILRPSLLNARLEPYQQPDPNTWIIFPYDLAPDARGRLTAHVLQPAEMAARFPGCWAYLNARRTELEQRSITGGLTAERPVVSVWAVAEPHQVQ